MRGFVRRIAKQLVRDARPGPLSREPVRAGRPAAHLFALYAFNLEIARVREPVSEPMPGEIRLQWWRDALVGAAAARSAPSGAAALRDTIARYGLPPRRCST